MKLRQLEYFLAVAEELHFTRAAAKVNVSQSVLSRQIQALEAELGTSLLTRTSRDVKLTAAGDTLRVHARRILSEVHEAKSNVAISGPVLRVATYGTGGTSIERKVINAYRATAASGPVEILIVLPFPCNILQNRPSSRKKKTPHNRRI